MSSHPDPTCNPWGEDDMYSSWGKAVGVAISTGLLMAAVGWITWHGEKVLELLGVPDESVSLLSGGKEKEGDESQPESRPSRVFYCSVMACACAFAAMTMTSWTRTDGSPESYGSVVTPLESVWLKIISQWICLVLQMRVLWVTFREGDNNGYRSF